MSAWDGIAGAAAGGIANLVSGFFTNKTNTALARETNAMQERLFNQQLEYNTEMWEKNNEYNSPLAQVARYREAGINPYLAMFGTGAGSGNSASPAAGANVPQMNNPQVSPVDVGTPLAQAADMMYNRELRSAEASKAREEAKGVSIDNLTRNASNLAKIEELAQNARNASERAEYTAVERQLKRATFDSVVYQAELQNKSLEEQNELTYQTRLGVQLDNELSSLHLRDYDKNFAANLAEVWSRVQLNNANTGVAIAQQKKLAQDVLESVARAYGYKLDNGVKFKIQQYLVNSAKAKSERDIEEAENVSLFGIPNPSFETNTNFGAGGKGFTIGASGQNKGYSAISGAKHNAREVKKQYEKK